MELVINLQSFMPIKTFRAQHGLPASFGVGMFEPKDYTGLGRIDRAGAELNLVRQAVLDALPAQMPLAGWLDFLPALADLLEKELNKINPQVGLKQVEIDYAVAGFRDMCQLLLYGMIRAQSAGEAPPDFRRVYYDWLSSTIRISSAVHHYIHQGAIWAVQIIHHAYGRTGLVIWTDDETYYVQDNALGCPAEGFMAALLQDVGAHIMATAR
jgi:hypothetical protein